MKSLAVWPVRRRAHELGERLAVDLGGVLLKPWQETLSATDTGSGKGDFEVTQKRLFAQTYRQYSAWIVIGTTGIAVRFLDGLMCDKRNDPAVVVVDESGRFAVSLICGHEGGANDLAFKAASSLGAVPVVTTATEALKHLVVGIGCRRGVSAETIERAVLAALSEHDLAEVRQVATIDLKKDEPGLLQFCAKYSLPLHVISASDVQSRCWVTNRSAWVKEITGADGVCEPAALISSLRGGLIVPKTILQGVAVAIVSDRTTGQDSPEEPTSTNLKVEL